MEGTNKMRAELEHALSDINDPNRPAEKMGWFDWMSMDIEEHAERKKREKERSVLDSAATVPPVMLSVPSQSPSTSDHPAPDRTQTLPSITASAEPSSAMGSFGSARTGSEEKTTSPPSASCTLALNVTSSPARKNDPVITNAERVRSATD